MQSDGSLDVTLLGLSRFRLGRCWDGTSRSLTGWDGHRRGEIAAIVDVQPSDVGKPQPGLEDCAYNQVHLLAEAEAVLAPFLASHRRHRAWRPIEEALPPVDYTSAERLSFWMCAALQAAQVMRAADLRGAFEATSPGCRLQLALDRWCTTPPVKTGKRTRGKALDGSTDRIRLLQRQGGLRPAPKAIKTLLALCAEEVADLAERSPPSLGVLPPCTAQRVVATLGERGTLKQEHLRVLGEAGAGGVRQLLLTSPDATAWVATLDGRSFALLHDLALICCFRLEDAALLATLLRLPSLR